MTNKLKRRFGRADEPVTVRRHLQELYQRDDERLEEFAERAHELTIDGYPGIDDATIETIATDAFLKGCQEKRAALTAMDSKPDTRDQALQAVKNESNNQRVLLGEHKPKVRHSQFLDDFLDSPEIRMVQSSSQAPAPAVKTNEGSSMKTVMESVLVTNHALLLTLKALSERDAPRYPTPPGSPRRSDVCFRCGVKGHFMRECS